MADEDVILEFKKKAEHLLPYLDYESYNIDYKSYQLEDGKLFFLVKSSELLLKWRGHTFKKDLKGKDLKEQENAPVFGMCAFGNELYYRQNRKIFKAFFVCPKIKVSFVRHMHELETVEEDGFCTRTKADGRLVYRLNEEGKSEFPLTSESHNGYAAGFGLFALFLCHAKPAPSAPTPEEGATPCVAGLALDRAFAYELNPMGPRSSPWSSEGLEKCYVRDDNTIYLSHDGELALIRNGEIEHLSYIWITDSSPDQFRNIHKIVGVYNGVITVEVKTTAIDGYTIKKELWTARLNTVERKETTAAMLKAIHDMTAEMKELRKKQEKLIDSVVKINESLIKIIASK